MPFPPDQPVLPYGGDDDPNSGFAAGVATSEERTRTSDTSGRTAQRQSTALRSLAWAGGRGVTWGELADEHGWHHGTASGVLSVLHKAGKVARLSERRGKSFIYVHPDYVYGRDTQDQGRRQQTRYTREDMARAYVEGYSHGTGCSVAFAGSSRAVSLANPYTDGAS